MQKPLPASPKRLWIASLLIPSILPLLHSQELAGNGDFEAGRLPPWNVTQSGPLVALTAENSPFHSIYPVGAASVRLKDDDSDFQQPSLSQTFAGQPAIVFGFDFKVASPGDPSPWYVAWDGEGATTGFFFSLGGADGSSIEFNQQKIADLKNVWYHVEGWADAPQQAVQGTISNTLGDTVSFQGGFPFGVQRELSSIVVSDGDAARNPDVLLDNFYTRPIGIQITRGAQGQEVLTWLATNFTLQTAASVLSGAQWSDVPSANGSYTNTFTDPIRFFRLKD